MISMHRDLRTYSVIFALALPVAISQPMLALANDCAYEMNSVLKRITSNAFQVDRKLSDYFDFFAPTGFRDDVADLTASQLWIDMGTGEGHALEDFIRTPRYRGNALGITAGPQIDAIRLDGLANASKGRLKWSRGKLLENIPQTELPKAQLITDVFGPLSYTKQVDVTLQRYLDLLDTNGTLYFRYSPDRNLVRDANGIYAPTFLQWLQSIEGIKVSVNDLSQKNIKITKIAKNVKIPELSLESMADGAPPVRKYVPVKKNWMDKIFRR